MGAAATSDDRAGAIAAAVRRQAEDAGVELPHDLMIFELAGSAIGVSERHEADLARLLEAVTPNSDRQSNGLHVTPDWLADELVGRAVGSLVPAAATACPQVCDPPAAPAICDPACGGGAFLLAAARFLHARGLGRRQVVEHCLWGADIDPVGLATAEAALAAWAGVKPPVGRLVVADMLTAGLDVWMDRPAAGFDAVVGNPPFLNRLASVTAWSDAERQAVRRRFGSAVRAYTDTAWLFLLLGADLARPEGRVALLQPVSIVAARDAAAVRAELDRGAVLRELWVEQDRVFDASVRVCCPVLEKAPHPSSDADSPADVAGAEVDADPECRSCDAADAASDRRPGLTRASDWFGRTGWAGSPNRALDGWADRLADAIGAPRVELRSPLVVGELADVGAGFRGEYYGLVPLVREACDGEAPGAAAGVRGLLTVGVLDWGHAAWGERPTRFARRRWQRPVVDLDLAPSGARSTTPEGKAAAWLARTGRPKVVVANQTRVVEPVADPSGAWVPSVPALGVMPHDPEEVWSLAAAIGSPAATAWLLRRAPGTALARDALKISPGDLAALPLPVDRVAWEKATAAFRRLSTGFAAGRQWMGGEDFETYCREIARAYQTPAEVEAWWRSRLPERLRTSG